MKKSILFIIAMVCAVSYGDVKITQLPAQAASTTGANDVFPMVNVTLGTTNKIKLSDLINLPSMQTQFLSLVPSQTGNNGKCLSTNGASTLWTSCAPSTSVGLTVPAFLSVSGSPVVGIGTLAVSLSGTALPVANGGTNSTTTLNNSRVMQSLAGAIVEAAAITGNKALASDTNGIPVASTTTDTELGYVAGVTSAIQTQLNAKVPTTRNVNTTAPLAGGGALSADLTLSIPVATSSVNGYLSSTDWSTFNNKQPAGSYITALTGDVTATGPGSSAATIANSAVTNAKMANMVAHTYKGNNTGSTAAPIDVTSTQLTADLNLFTNTLQGLVPGSGGGTTNFLRADGTWASPPSGTVTSVALTVPAFLSVAGSPVTSSGTLAVSFSGTALPVANGGTGITAGTSGGVLGFTAAGTIASSVVLQLNRLVLGGGAGATPTVLGSLGTTTTLLHGNAGGAPTFSAVDLTADVTNTLPVANGGLGIATGTSGGILGFTAAGTIASSAVLTANRIVLGGGAGATPTVLGSLGTTTTLLHGNAAGAPTFGAASLTADVSGTLPVANGGTGQTTVAAVRSGATGFGIGSGQSASTSGTTYTTPATITTATQFKFTIVGGGGGGGGENVINTQSAGGGGGDSCVVYLTGLSPSTGYTISIGAAGAAGAAAAGNGGNGGNTTISINATTYTAGGGTGGQAGATNNGGAGGTGTNCTVDVPGQSGGASQGAVVGRSSGKGGDSLLGFGGGDVSVVGNGNAGSGHGSGGSGASSGGAGQSGGAGTAGIILVEFFD